MTREKKNLIILNIGEVSGVLPHREYVNDSNYRSRFQFFGPIFKIKLKKMILKAISIEFQFAHHFYFDNM